jgi:uncharacterized protein YgiB involved in biofilm formation
MREQQITTRADLLRRWGELKAERASWMPHWRELSQFLLPRSGRYFIQDRNRGARRHNQIYDSTGTRSVRVLAAGMMSGMTSPARPWFRLSTPDADLNKHQPVKLWLAACTDLMLSVFNKSNVYRALHQTYEELGVFGTAAKIIMPDYKNVVHHASLTAGEYCIATDFRGNVDTIAREFEKTVAECVKEFGYENCSKTVQGLWDNHSLGAWVPIIQIIEPRADRERDFKSKLATDMAWRSVYFEQGANSDEYLLDSGYNEFPGLCSRWAVSGGDIYGNSPGMEALGDVKQLQQQQLRKAQAIDYQTKPPLVAPTSYKNNETDMLPGGITFGDGSEQIKTAFEVRLDLGAMLGDIQDVRERIKSSFYADLFLMLSEQNETRMTATEVAERHEEKMLMLGPTVERLHNEELNPLIQSTFNRMLRVGMLPQPPQELHGVTLQVEFISMLAQAQRAIGTNSIDRFVGNLGQIATFAPGVLDKFDADDWADEYSDMLGISPSLIVSNDKVALIRQGRAQQAQAQQQAAQQNQAADTIQKLGNASTADNTALASLVSRGGLVQTAHPAGPTAGFSGYT